MMGVFTYIVIKNDDEDVNQYWQSLDDGRSMKINERAFVWNIIRWDDNEYIDKYGWNVIFHIVL